ncbi:hypothetical protein H6P81_002069 [Aristolochia fimbriata]|uniref:Uncharacterized protein n=1 Tax=Aristolochia fimbriata TaxID=158543 RepID=A0AAV7FCJ8_ARIFI|nr:hypothetical protein H6P81_002069 [Aristolochia fimbriata]
MVSRFSLPLPNTSVRGPATLECRLGRGVGEETEGGGRQKRYKARKPQSERDASRHHGPRALMVKAAPLSPPPAEITKMPLLPLFDAVSSPLPQNLPRRVTALAQSGPSRRDCFSGCHVLGPTGHVSRPRPPISLWRRLIVERDVAVAGGDYDSCRDD